MATDKVRVTAYVDEEAATVLRESAAALGQTQSALLGEVLGNAVPVLRILRDMAISLQEAPNRHREVLAQLAVDMEPLVEASREGLDSLARLAEGPPPSNTGVRK